MIYFDESYGILKKFVEEQTFYLLLLMASLLAPLVKPREVLTHFDESYGIMNNLKKKQNFYVLLLMDPLLAPLVTYGIVIKSQLK